MISREEAAMLTIYKTTERGLEQLDSMANGSWVKVFDPTPEEMQQLVTWGIDADYINYSLDLDEMPRMERDEDYTFILVRIPHRQPDSDIPYITIPLGIMIKGNLIVTICRYDKEMFRVLANGKYRLLKTGKRYRFALYIFLETATRYLTHLREINRITEALEDQLQKSTRNREVLELLKYQKSLTYFATALRSNEVMFERVQRTQIFNYYEEDQDLLEDVLTENQQAIQMTNINTEILSSMMDAFASIISNNLNSVMKALAAITIIINVPAVVAAFYGMNVELPGEGHPQAFLLVFGISLALTAIAIFIFYKRDWF
jgi:magnesium transporter